MVRLDSFAYRLLWNLKNFLHFRNKGPNPIIYNEPCRNFIPPSNFVNLLDKQKTANFEALKQELKILTCVFNQLPEKLEEKDWHSLVNLSSTKDRFYYLRFLYNREKKRRKEEKKKLLNEENKHQKPIERNKINNDNQSLFYINNSHLDSLEKRLATNRIIQAFRLKEEYPIIAIDCRWLHLHSERGLNLAFKQLKYLIGKNRDREWPWPLFLTNFIKEDDEKIVEAKRKHFSIIYGNLFTSHITSKSYLELFSELKEKQKIIYLSPHSKEPLESVEANTCYVIGGIVDAFSEPRIPSKASLEIALQEGIQCKRLNLDYSSLKGGNPMFTLDQVLDILHDVYDKSDWNESIKRYVPKRKFLLKSEKNLKMKILYKNIAERNKQIIGILQKNNKENNNSSVILQKSIFYHTSTNCLEKDKFIKIERTKQFDGTIKRKPTGLNFLEKQQDNYTKLIDIYFPKMFDISNLTKIIGFAIILDSIDEEKKNNQMDLLYFILMTTNLLFCILMRRKMNVIKSKKK
ncbi:SAM-dependent MTase TRM10-type domain-containing protein [Meloidogyne graminicola]|uniref:SAM-dependent MTase TRM10-type domain-containing protein n=1 Tax=Meloidogyne graminicola TaxID=189291 RepID=A0A8S9ZZK0_9BILA|nr:SAM-dependent MTase TRM10-type domain-containing protein [Meloidogyne graminicola]